MTNFERIKAMSVEELALFLNDEDTFLLTPCSKRYCPHFENDGLICRANQDKECQKATVNWLNDEVEI